MSNLIETSHIPAISEEEQAFAGAQEVARQLQERASSSCEAIEPPEQRDLAQEILAFALERAGVPEDDESLGVEVEWTKRTGMLAFVVAFFMTWFALYWLRDVGDSTIWLILLIPALGCMYCEYRCYRHVRYLQGQLKNARRPMLAQGWRELAKALLDMPESRLRRKLAKCLLENPDPNVNRGVVRGQLSRKSKYGYTYLG